MIQQITPQGILWPCREHLRTPVLRLHHSDMCLNKNNGEKMCPFQYSLPVLHTLGIDSNIQWSVYKGGSNSFQWCRLGEFLFTWSSEEIIMTISLKFAIKAHGTIRDLNTVRDPNTCYVLLAKILTSSLVRYLRVFLRIQAKRSFAVIWPQY